MIVSVLPLQSPFLSVCTDPKNKDNGMKKITGIVEKSIFDDKKFMIIMIAETALPWLVAVFGNIASYYFSTG